jgi:hypothetical protein
MARYAPIATLAAVAALGGALFVVNEVNNPANVPTVAEQAAGDAPPVPAAAPAPAAPAPAAPAAPEAPAVVEQAYTGRSAGNEVTVAIAVKDGRAVGYICDGDKIEAWLEGTLRGGTLTLEGADGKSTVNGTSTGSATLGSVVVGGREWPFSAAGVEAPAGIYEGNASVRGVATRVGWIVSGDGSVVGVANSGGRRGPAPALDPADPYAVEVDGVAVAVSAIDGSDAVVRR